MSKLCGNLVGWLLTLRMISWNQSKSNRYTAHWGWWDNLCKGLPCESLATLTLTLSRATKFSVCRHMLTPQWSARYCGRFIFFKKIYLVREREKTRVGGGAKEEGEDLKPTPPLSTEPATAGSHSPEIVTWAETKLHAQPTEPPRPSTLNTLMLLHTIFICHWTINYDKCSSLKSKNKIK